MGIIKGFVAIPVLSLAPTLVKAAPKPIELAIVSESPAAVVIL